jgi:hypothetical protein
MSSVASRLFFKGLASPMQKSIDKTLGILRDLMGAQIVLHPTAEE